MLFSSSICLTGSKWRNLKTVSSPLDGNHYANSRQTPITLAANRRINTFC